MTHHDNQRRVPPHKPLYADQKVLGITLSTRAKVILGLTTLVIVLLVFYVVNYEDTQNARHDQASRDRAAQDAQIKANANAIDVAFENVRELACGLIAELPPTLTAPVNVPSIRSKYQCPTTPSADGSLPPFVGPTPTPSTPPRAQNPSVSPSAHEGTPRASVTVTATRTAVVQGPTSTATVTKPGATVTLTRSGVLGPICSLPLGLC